MASEILFDSNESHDGDEAADDGEDLAATPETPKKKQRTDNSNKATGVALLAQEVGRGMTAITDAMKPSQPATQDADRPIATQLRAQHDQQMAMTVQLVDMQRTQNEWLECLLLAIAK